MPVAVIVGLLTELGAKLGADSAVRLSSFLVNVKEAGEIQPRICQNRNQSTIVRHKREHSFA